MGTYPETESIPPILVTAVGSLPHTDPDRAVDLVLRSLVTAPHPPQLSRADPREQMWIQFSEGLPRFRADLQSLSYYFDTSGDAVAEVEAFFSRYLAVVEGGSPEAFEVGPEYGKGIHRFHERVKLGNGKRPFLKVQVTGPMSFALTVTDENRKPIFYHDLFRDVAVKAMGLKAVWLLELFKPLAENIIVFFDEPSLAAYGSSAYLGVSKQDVIDSLDDVMGMVVERGGIPGVHCCGNTDWGLLMETSTRIVNFDAVAYLDSMAIYPRELTDFLARGGALAWGAVPNTEAIRQESVESVTERIRSGLKRLEGAGVNRDLLSERIIITPACGCSGLSVEDAEAVYRTLGELERNLDERTFAGRV